MPNILTKLIDRTLSVRLSEEDRNPPLPTLPQNRPRVLTPSPSHESLVLSAASATADSGFFQKLPSDVRRMILVEAFGGYTVHMHLSYDIPKAPLHVRQRDPKHNHANIRFRGTYGKSYTRLGIPRVKTWQWWSCICHRCFPSPPCGKKPSVDNKLFNDTCYSSGYGTRCEFWPGDANGKCFLGVMGWLLSCRQSYAECITLLYSTNTIHMASSVMMRHLPQLLLPQRLASMTSVEMIWHAHPVWYGSDLRSSLDVFGLPAIRSLMDVLESSMPSLRHLSISLDYDIRLSCDEEDSDDQDDEHKPVISTPLDCMVRRMRRARPHLEVNIYIPFDVYEKRNIRSGCIRRLWYQEKREEDNEIWRELPGGGDGGYWIRYGDFFRPPNPLSRWGPVEFNME